MRYGKTTKMIEDLKQSDNKCLIVKNKKEKDEIVKQFTLSFKNGSKILFPKHENYHQKKDDVYTGWSSFETAFYKNMM